MRSTTIGDEATDADEVWALPWIQLLAHIGERMRARTAGEAVPEATVTAPCEVCRRSGALVVFETAGTLPPRPGRCPACRGVGRLTVSAMARRWPDDVLRRE
jgi:hypothetical protein